MLWGPLDHLCRRVGTSATIKCNVTASIVCQSSEVEGRLSALEAQLGSLQSGMDRLIILEKHVEKLNKQRITDKVDMTFFAVLLHYFLHLTSSKNMLLYTTGSLSRAICLVQIFGSRKSRQQRAQQNGIGKDTLFGARLDREIPCYVTMNRNEGNNRCYGHRCEIQLQSDWLFYSGAEESRATSSPSNTPVLNN